MNAKRNYIYNMIYNILSVVTPLITAPYLSRVLGTDGIGIYSYYYAIAYYFTLMGKMGLTNYGTRQIAEVKSDEESVKKVFSSIYCMQLIVSVFIAIIYFVVVTFVIDKDRMVGYVFGIWIIGTIINIDWFLFGLERFKETATRNIIVRIVELIAIFILVRNDGDVWKYCLICALGYTIGYISFWDFGKKYISFTTINKNEVLKHLKPCLILMIPVIALNIYRSMDKVMLGSICDMRETGLYESAEKIIYSLTLFVSSLGTVMMPRMSALLSEGKTERVKQGIENSITFVVFMTSAMCFGILSISESLIPWFYGDEFYGSIILINLLTVTLILIGWGNVVRTQYIIPMKMDDIYIKSISLGAIVNLVVNSILIPKYAAVGACIGTLAAECVVPIYQGIRLRKELEQGKYIKTVIPFVGIGLIMFAILKFVEELLGSGFTTMLLQIFVGAIIYVGLSFLYAYRFLPSLLQPILAMKRKKVHPSK